MQARHTGWKACFGHHSSLSCGHCDLHVCPLARSPCLTDFQHSVTIGSYESPLTSRLESWHILQAALYSQVSSSEINARGGMLAAEVLTNVAGPVEARARVSWCTQGVGCDLSTLGAKEALLSSCHLQMRWIWVPEAELC